jgi:hypothetical protein
MEQSLFRWRSLALGLLMLISGKVYSQQEIAAYDLSDNWYTRSLNPAFVPGDRKFHLGLVNASTDLWSDSRLNWQQFQRYFGGGLPQDTYDYILERLGENSSIALDQRVDALSFGFRVKGGYFVSFMHAIRIHAGATVPRELPELILLGNDNVKFWDKDVNIAPVVKGLGWQEARMAVSKKFGNLSVGAGVNFLLGTSTVETDPAYSTVRLYTDPSDLRVISENSYRLWSSNALESFDFQNLRPGASVVEPVLVSGIGYAFDAGVNWKLNESIILSGSVLDYGGRIIWKKNTYSFSINNEYTYTGGEIESEVLLDGSDGLQLNDQGLNQLNESFTFQRSGGLFSSTIPTRYYGKVMCILSPKLALHLTYFRQESSIHQQNSIGIGMRLKPARWFSLGVTAVSGSNGQPGIGANMMLSPGPLQFFIATDNYKSLTQTDQITRFNLRTGLSLAFGKPPAEAKKEAFEKKNNNQF